MLDAETECWAAEKELGWERVADSGMRMFEVFRGEREDGDGDGEGDLVWKLLGGASMQKVMHGKKILEGEQLGGLWDENEGADCGEGTWGEVLRLVGVGFEQTRERVNTVEGKKSKLVVRKGLLEA